MRLRIVVARPVMASLLAAVGGLSGVLSSWLAFVGEGPIGARLVFGLGAFVLILFGAAVPMNQAAVAKPKGMRSLLPWKDQILWEEVSGFSAISYGRGHWIVAVHADGSSTSLLACPFVYETRRQHHDRVDRLVTRFEDLAASFSPGTPTSS